MTEPKYLNSGQVAQILNVSRRLIQRMAKDGELPSYAIAPRTIRFRLDEIEKYLAKLKVGIQR